LFPEKRAPFLRDTLFAQVLGLATFFSNRCGLYRYPQPLCVLSLSICFLFRDFFLPKNLLRCRPCFRSKKKNGDLMYAVLFSVMGFSFKKQKQFGLR